MIKMYNILCEISTFLFLLTIIHVILQLILNNLINIYPLVYLIIISLIACHITIYYYKPIRYRHHWIYYILKNIQKDQ